MVYHNLIYRLIDMTTCGYIYQLVGHIMKGLSKRRREHCPSFGKNVIVQTINRSILVHLTDSGHSIEPFYVF